MGFSIPGEGVAGIAPVLIAGVDRVPGVDDEPMPGVELGVPLGNPRFIILPKARTNSAASSNISSSIPSSALYTSAIESFARRLAPSKSFEQSYRKAQYSSLTLSRSGWLPGRRRSASRAASAKQAEAVGM